MTLLKLRGLYDLIRRAERSQRLRINKFAMLFTVWSQFIENSQNCYKSGAYKFKFITTKNLSSKEL